MNLKKLVLKGIITATLTLTSCNLDKTYSTTYSSSTNNISVECMQEEKIDISTNNTIVYIANRKWQLPNLTPIDPLAPSFR